MSNRDIKTIQIPPVSAEFATQLKRVFRPLEIKPGVTHEDTLYNAGQQSVLEYIDRHVVNKTVSGNPEDLREYKEMKHTSTWINRLFRQGDANENK